MRQVLSIDEFYRLPTLDAGKRELIEGEVIDSLPAIAFHHTIADRIGDALKDYMQRSGQSRARVRVESGFEIPGKRRSWVQPDVAVLHPQQPINRSRYFEGAPLIAIEVISLSNTARDIDRKRAIYQANGCEELWVVYPETMSITVERSKGGGIVRYDSNLVDSCLPGFTLNFGKLFGNL